MVARDAAAARPSRRLTSRPGIGCGSAGTALRVVNTLRQLKVVEAERDTWQRPAEVVRALDGSPWWLIVARKRHVDAVLTRPARFLSPS